MSLIKANAVQIGQSPTATQNFTLAVPSSPDGTIKLARGNAGATTQDVMSVDASGNVNGLVKSTGSTTARSLADRFAEMVNVKDYGAIGNGITDDTTAIQNAINYCISGNKKELWFPSGVYVVSAPSSESLPQSFAAALIIDGLTGCKIHGSNATIKAGTSGTGAPAFSLFRLQRVNQVEICNLTFEGDYANHTGDAGSRSGGIIITTFDRINNSIDLGESRAIYIHDIECNDIGGFVWVVNRNESLARQLNVYDLRIEDCFGRNAAKSNNTLSLNYTVGISAKRNWFINDVRVGSEIPTMFIDCSRGCEDADVSFNYGTNFCYGMKCESVVGSGPSGTEERFSKNIKFSNNQLLQIGDPLQASPGVGPSTGDTYGIRINGVDVVCRNNQISGVSVYSGSAGLQSCIYPLFTHASDSTIYIEDNQCFRGQWGIIPGNAAGNLVKKQNIYITNNVLRDHILDGIIAQARCTVEGNKIYSVGRYAVEIQIADQTRVNRNQSFNCGASSQAGVFYQSQNNSSLGYWEFLDNDVFDTRGANAIGFAYSLVSGGYYTNNYNIRAGMTLGVQTGIFLAPYFGNNFATGAALMKVVGNPTALTIAEEINVLSLTNFDANTVQINFKRPIPTTNIVFSSLIDPNIADRRWVNWGVSSSYIRLRYTNMAGTPQSLPTGISVATY